MNTCASCLHCGFEKAYWGIYDTFHCHVCGYVTLRISFDCMHRNELGFFHIIDLDLGNIIVV